MELKEYQHKALDRVKAFLEALAKEHESGHHKHSSADAWEKITGTMLYAPHRDGIGRDIPTFCLKIPTGGGKTLLAVKIVDLINTTYLKRQTGVVLWIVPTTQIYNQTIQSLRQREHPYRQHLDIASGGKTLVLEKADRFTQSDVRENLVVMMLMLPSAARQNKETLRLFKDSGGFQDFFPAEDNPQAHAELLKQVPNLDAFGEGNGFFGKQIKTSLGNTLRLLSPVIILDEGHKAYSDTAQQTLRGFNPSIIVELSATPPQQSNKLVTITGMDLHREEMIKLDLHIVNKASPKWQDTLLDAINRLELLQKKAHQYEAETGRYIRPICLIQVERTGKEQIESGKIHSEHVREWLITTQGIAPEEIAIKTSEKDELKEVDNVGGLMSKDCKIRFIITKQALQEGWDCAFAYVLCVLTNPTSETAMTQLVGRILRQPYARKTRVRELDESYVYCHQRRGADLLQDIRKGFGEEGLGDLTGKVTVDEHDRTTDGETTLKATAIREQFRGPASHVILPVFVIQDSHGWRKVSYEMDILSRIDWGKVGLDKIYSLALQATNEMDKEHIAGFSKEIDRIVEYKEVKSLKEGSLQFDPEFMTRHLIEVVPNPWIAYDISTKVETALSKKYSGQVLTNNFVFIIEELKKHLYAERDRLSESVFRNLVEKDIVRLLVISNELNFKFPVKKFVSKDATTLNKKDGTPLQRSLFDFVPEDDFNDTEKAVAWYLDDQDLLLFWYRNVPRTDYAIQGWQKHKIYPDFIFTTTTKDTNKFDKLYVAETKGEHLKGNPDTDYKRKVFAMCNKLAKEIKWEEFGKTLEGVKVQYDIIDSQEWEQKLNAILAE